MLSDMVWRGLFHHHIMTSGGRAATPARTTHADNDLKLPAMAAAHTAEIQTVVTAALMERNCIETVYGPALNGAVPEWTDAPWSSPREPPDRSQTGHPAPANRGTVRSGTAPIESIRYSLWWQGLTDHCASDSRSAD